MNFDVSKNVMKHSLRNIFHISSPIVQLVKLTVICLFLIEGSFSRVNAFVAHLLWSLR